jgi:hypothetical protein
MKPDADTAVDTDVEGVMASPAAAPATTKLIPIAGAVDGVALEGPLVPAAILTLGARVADLMDPATFSPAGIVVDRRGTVSLQPAPLDLRFVAPEGPKRTAVAAVWALGRFLLELSLGHPVANDQLATFTQASLTALIDLQGRPLAPRLVDVLWAMIAQDPASRLQGPRAVARVCTDAAATFGSDGLAALAAAAATHNGPPLHSTREMSAKAILDINDIRRLRDPTPDRRKTLPPWSGAPSPHAATGVSSKDVDATVVNATVVNDDSDDNDDSDFEVLRQLEQRRLRMLLAGGVVTMLAVVAGLVVAIR